MRLQEQELQVLDLYREEREGDRRPAFVDGLLEFAGASPAADEVDPGVGANVADSEKRLMGNDGAVDFAAANGSDETMDLS